LKEKKRAGNFFYQGGLLGNGKKKGWPRLGKGQKLNYWIKKR